ncbi:LysR family transcriptional regulator [Leucothrix pacifica]|uniref:LysR family transcriptional regulator n=1 Tax=Leucothrix pacifica TaxID=1247513 RepID=A0A317CQW7_9GAMM|nr:LysR family transcriptional regulator [Leucothrix pacifica]PWR00588.1 LysR family transcriptional regulator [Leucothrix pacifica]
MKKNITPKLDRITLKQFRAYTAYVRAGTIKGAANILHISPPAVSQQLSLLQDNVGTSMVVKRPDGVQPSDFGQEILLAASRIENVLEMCQTSLQKLGDRTSGRVSLGIFNSANYFAPRLIAEFKKSHPNVDVRIRIGNRESVFKAFRNYEFDFLVVGRPPEDMDMESVVIGDHPHIIIGPPDHPLINQKKLGFKEFSDETFLVREEGSGTRLVMLKLFEEAGINPGPGMEVGNNESIKQAVMAGLGIALISAHTVADELKDGRLKEFDIEGLPVIRKWLVVRHKNIDLAPAAEALFNFFIESGVDFLPKYRQE